MSERFDRLFEQLDPPRSGLAELRSRIERDGRRQVRARRLRAVAATFVVLVVTGLLLFPTGEPRKPLRPAFSPTGVRLGLQAEPAEPVTIPAEMRGELAAFRVPLESPDVVFYMIGSRAPEPQPAEEQPAE
jgi:hypothetical protein